MTIIINIEEAEWLEGREQGREWEVRAGRGRY